MKKNLLFIILAVLAIGGYLYYSHLTTSTMKMTTTVEEPGFTIEMPKAFYQGDEADSYINDDKLMFVEFNYYTNELNLDSKAMIYSAIYFEFYEDDILSVEAVNIDGQDVWQAEYKTLTTGMDGIHYYYSGIITAFMLDDEAVIVDAYQAMDESEGINSEIRQEDLQLLKDITATVRVTDASQSSLETYNQKYECDALTLVLLNSWVETTADENGYYDFGYYASYYMENTSIQMEIYEYNEDNKFTEEEITSASDDYVFIGTTQISGEKAYVYSYEAYTIDGYEPFYYGVLAASEHYWIDFYFRAYADDYKMTEETIETITDLISSIE